MAGERGVAVELQRLHGMGEALYDAAAQRFGPLSLRVYAPVGEHEDLLPYLVRRLLENGANTVLCIRCWMTRQPPRGSPPTRSPRSKPSPATARIPCPAISTPSGATAGIDLSMAAERAAVRGAGRLILRSPPAVDASEPHIDAAFAAARAAQPAGTMGGGAAPRSCAPWPMRSRPSRAAWWRWRARPARPGRRVAEVREAADFCRYYAFLAERDFAWPETLKGPVGETNALELHGRGVFACISPWNFPLSIFTGQIAAALAAGNAVLAKPAEQTPLIAAAAVRLFHGAGLRASCCMSRDAARPSAQR